MTISQGTQPMKNDKLWEPEYDDHAEPPTECDHAIYFLNARGRLHGSWGKERIGRFIRISCRVCGKFYGYIPPPEDPRRKQQKRKNTG